MARAARGSKSRPAGKLVLAHHITDFKAGLEKFAAMFTDNYGLKLVFRGTEARTDGKTIIVPELSLLERKNMTEAEVTEALNYLTCTRGYVYHEGAHVIFTDMSTTLNNIITKTGGMKFKQLCNTLEDLRVERKVGKVYPGAKETLHFSNVFLFDEIAKTYSTTGKVDPYVQLLYAFMLLGGMTGPSGRDHALWPKLDLPVRQRAKQFRTHVDRATAANSTAELVKIAAEIWKLLKENKDPEERKPPPSDKKPPPEAKEPNHEDYVPEDAPKSGKGKPEDEDEDDGKKAGGRPSEEDDDGDDDSDESSDEDDEDDGEGDDEGDADDDDDGDGDESESDSGDGDADDDAGSDGDDDADGGGASGDEDESDDGEEGEDGEEDDAGSGGDGDGDDESDADDGADGGDGSEGGDDSGDDESDGDDASDGDGEDSDDGDTDGDVEPDDASGGDASAATAGELGIDKENDTKATHDLRSHLTEGARTAATLTDRTLYRVFSTERDYIGPPPEPVDLAERQRRGHFVKELDEETRAVYGPMISRLEGLLKARTHSYNIHGLESGDLDQSALHNLAIGARNPHPLLRQQARRVFKQKVPGLSLDDTCVALSIDRSGSMSNGDRDVMAMKCTDILGNALHGVGVPFEVAAWSTRPTSWYGAASYTERELYARWSALDIYVIKSFEETWMHTRDRLQFIKAASCNVDGESIGYSVSRLLQRREKRKVLIVLCDGQPSGESGDKTDQVHHHLHDTIASARARGVEVYCIGIQTAAPAIYYAKDRTKYAATHVDPWFAHVNKIDDLPAALMRQLEAVLFR